MTSRQPACLPIYCYLRLPDGEDAGDLVPECRLDDHGDTEARRHNDCQDDGVLRHALAFLAAKGRERIRQADLSECEQTRQFDSPPLLRAFDVRTTTLEQPSCE